MVANYFGHLGLICEGVTQQRKIKGFKIMCKNCKSKYLRFEQIFDHLGFKWGRWM